jgi:periplasmic protein TonB
MDNWGERGQTLPVAAREPTQGEQGDMHADEIVLAAEGGALTLEAHLAALRNERPRVFWLGLTLALLVHALFIVGIGRSASNRTLGKEDGASDAIAVEIVDGATLKDSMAPPAPPSAAPPAKRVQQQQPQQPQEAQPEPPTPPTPPTPPEVAAQPPPPAAAPAPPEKPPEAKTALQTLPEDFADALAELESTPEDQEKPQKAPEAVKPEPKQEAKPAEKQPPQKQAPQKQQQAKPKPKPRTQTSALDLSVPSDSGTDGDDGGSSSAVQRPPGITRSGENDEFARNVIRALQKTMPRIHANGRVTVRIVLSENGSRADVQLLKSGGDSDLDFNVVFAARQTAYPFPPNKSTLVDRTFTVTYIYR